MPDEIKKIDDLKANPKLLMAAITHAKSIHVEENLMFYFDKGNAQALYPKYIDPKSANAINIDGSLIEQAKALATAQKWGDPAWTKILAQAKKEVGALYWADAWPKFKRSPQYTAATAPAAAPAPAPKTGDPAKAAKLLGIKDVDALKKALAEKDKAKAEKALEALAVKEKLRQKGKDMIAALEKAGLR